MTVLSKIAIATVVASSAAGVSAVESKKKGFNGVGARAATSALAFSSMVHDANGLVAGVACQRGTGFLAKSMPQGCVQAAAPHARAADVHMLFGRTSEVGALRSLFGRRNKDRNVLADESLDIPMETMPLELELEEETTPSVEDITDEADEATESESKGVRARMSAAFDKHRGKQGLADEEGAASTSAIVPAKEYKSQTFGKSSELVRRTGNGIAEVTRFWRDDIPEDAKRNAALALEEVAIVGESLLEAALEQPVVEQAIADLKYNVANAVNQAQLTLKEKSNNYYEDKITPKSRVMIASAVELLQTENQKLQEYFATEEGQAKVDEALEVAKQAQEVASAFVKQTLTDLNDKNSQLSRNLRVLRDELDVVSADLEEIIAPTLEGEMNKLTETEEFQDAIAKVDRGKMVLEEKIAKVEEVVEEKRPMVMKFLDAVRSKISDRKSKTTTVDIESEEVM